MGYVERPDVNGYVKLLLSILEKREMTNINNLA